MMEMSVCKLKSVMIQNYGQIEFLAIETMDSIFSQNYPAFNVGKENQKDQLDYICNFLDIDAPLSGKLIFSGDKDIYKFTDKGMIGLLYNPENNKFFSLQMKYTISDTKYQKIISDFKENNPDVTNLSDYEMSIYGYVQQSKVGKEDEQIYLNNVTDYIDKILLNERLMNTLNIQPKKGINKI